MCSCCFHGDKSDLDKEDANKWHDNQKEIGFTSAQGASVLALTSEITHAVDSNGINKSQIILQTAHVAYRTQ